jgi:acetyl esterase/lipase
LDRSAGAAVAIAWLAIPALAAEPMTLRDYMALNGPSPTAHIAYGPAPLQYVEMFGPAGPGPFPVVILIHGGCFMNSYQGMPQMRRMARALMAKSVAVWSIEYRGLDTPGGGYPGTYLDVRSAVDLLADQAKARHLDTYRLVAVGHSAGAALALWLAGREQLPKSSPLYEAHPLPVWKVVALGGSGDFRPIADQHHAVGCLRGRKHVCKRHLARFVYEQHINNRLSFRRGPQPLCAAKHMHAPLSNRL